MDKRLIAVTFSLLAVGIWLIIMRQSQDEPKLRIVAGSQPCRAIDCFESTSHYYHLYEGDTRISRVFDESLSPSGEYAAFEDGGKIMLYKRGSGNLKKITDDKSAVPKSFIWDETQSQLTINYYGNRSNSIIGLD